MAAKLGLNVVDKVFDRTAGVQDLDEEEEKLVNAFLMEEGAAGGKVHKKKERDAKPYDRPQRDRKNAAISRSRNGMLWHWHRTHDELGHETAAAVSVFHAHGGTKLRRRHAGDGEVFPNGNDDANRSHAHAKRMQAGGQGSGTGKRKHPCDNCRAMDHCKYLSVCPNFQMHLGQQAAKHLVSRQQQGQQAASLSRTVASPAVDGAGTTGNRQSKSLLIFRISTAINNGLVTAQAREWCTSQADQGGKQR
jgi:hypothetical protein